MGERKVGDDRMTERLQFESEQTHTKWQKGGNVRIPCVLISVFGGGRWVGVRCLSGQLVCLALVNTNCSVEIKADYSTHTHKK